MFAKIGMLTIGGGYAMLPLIQNELVTGGFMTEAETIDIFAISQITPGPLALNAATFAGMRLYGVPGAAAATLGVIAPSLLITLLAAKFFAAFHKRPLARGIMGGLRPAALGLILYSAVHITIGSLWLPNESLQTAAGAGQVDWFALAVAVLALAALQGFKKINPAAIILLAGLAGIAFEFFQ